MEEVTPFTLAITFAVTFLGGLIQGTVSFGMGIFIVIALAWFYPAATLVPFTTLVATVNLFDLARRRRVGWSSMLSPVLLFPTLIGTAIGTLLLVTVPDWGIKAAMGGAVLITGVLFAVRPPVPRADAATVANDVWEPYRHGKAISTFLASLFGGWLSTAGPPVILYGYTQMPAEAARRFLIRVFLLGVTVKLFTFALAGLWTREILLWAFLCVGSVLLGTALGHRASTVLSGPTFARLVWVLFAVMGFLLFVRTVSVWPVG